MSEAAGQDRLLPCLLERLADDNTSSTKEGREDRVISLRRYRESVLEDIRSLLNTARSLPADELQEFPEVAASVLNYGIPNLCGVSVSGLSPRDLEREIVEAILLFEPRIDADSLSVRANVSSEVMSGYAVSFLIEGVLWAQPMPEQLYLSTQLDLETGRWEVQRSANG